MSDDTAVALRVYVGAFVDELARCGVTDVCLCPGSRSTPLAMLVREHPKLKVWTHLDERSASYFALGMAKASRRAVAVLCTSGTAAANFMPAVAEAHNGHVPLIVLTADRPQELRDVGALQTIDQLRMYGSHAKWATEMLLPEATEAAARHARSIADRAVATALSSPQGPVHLNFPFREPLIPAPPQAAASLEGTKPQTIVEPIETGFPRIDIMDLASRLRTATKGLVVCGPLDVRMDEDDLRAFSRHFAVAHGLPVLVDGLSQMRCGPILEDSAIDRFDAFLRHEPTVASLSFDYVLRIGAMPVSKPLQQFLDRNAGAVQVVVSESGLWQDTGRTATHLGWGEGWFGTSAIDVLDILWDRVKDEGVPPEDPYKAERAAWFQSWRQVNETAATAIESALAKSKTMSEPLVFRRLAELVPENAIVFAGNSMPVRDLDSFWPASTKAVRFMANRGASGIDGVVSTALGVAAASTEPVVLVLGDISLYHDMNGLLAARRHNLKATIVVINNDGGGIFSFLPQAERGDHFEELFGTPHGLDFRHTAALYGLDYCLAQTPEDFDAAISHSLKSDGVSLIEVRTGRDENLVLHRKIWADVATALAEARQ